MLKIAIVGTGKMGSLIKETAQNQGMEVVHCFEKGIDDHCMDVDVVIDFSHPNNCLLYTSDAADELYCV